MTAARTYLFEGSPFLRSVLGFVLLLMALGMPAMILPNVSGGGGITPGLVVLVWLEALLLCLLLVMLSPRRFHWAGRTAAALWSLAYVYYLIDQLWTAPETLWPPGRRSDSSAFNAVVAFFVFALPAGIYAIRGRLGPDRSDVSACPFTVSWNSTIVRLEAEGRPSRTLAWDDLKTFRILTNDKGPLAEDLFLALDGENGGLVIPKLAHGSNDLIERLGELPDFDHRLLGEAMCCVSCREFLIWERS